MKSFLFKILFVFVLLLGARHLNAQKQITWQALDTAALHIDSLVYKKVAGKQLSLYYFLPQKTSRIKNIQLLYLFMGVLGRVVRLLHFIVMLHIFLTEI